MFDLIVLSLKNENTVIINVFDKDSLLCQFSFLLTDCIFAKLQQKMPTFQEVIG